MRTKMIYLQHPLGSAYEVTYPRPSNAWLTKRNSRQPPQHTNLVYKFLAMLKKPLHLMQRMVIQNGKTPCKMKSNHITTMTPTRITVQSNSLMDINASVYILYLMSNMTYVIKHALLLGAILPTPQRKALILESCLFVASGSPPSQPNLMDSKSWLATYLQHILKHTLKKRYTSLLVLSLVHYKATSSPLRKLYMVYAPLVHAGTTNSPIHCAIWDILRARQIQMYG